MLCLVARVRACCHYYYNAAKTGISRLINENVDKRWTQIKVCAYILCVIDIYRFGCSGQVLESRFVGAHARPRGLTFSQSAKTNPAEI